jgi:hypothetical protein
LIRNLRLNYYIERRHSYRSRRFDTRRRKEVADRPAIQVRDSAAWRDQILGYFQGFSKMQVNRLEERNRR